MSLLATGVLRHCLMLRLTPRCSCLKRSFTTPSAAAISDPQSTKECAKPLREIPGPPLLENLGRFARHGLRYHHVFMAEMFERYGPIFRHTFPGKHIVYISDPVDIEYVYRSQESGWPYRQELLMADYSQTVGLNKGLSGNDDSWYDHRKVVAPKLLRLGALKPYFTMILEVADDTVANFRDGKNLDLKEHLTKWAAESVGVVLFGLRIGTNYKSPNERAMKFIEATHGYFEAEAKLMLGIPFYKYITTPGLSQAFRHLDVQMEISRHFAAKTRNETTELAKASIAHRLENEDNICEADIIQICNNLFIGGIHTTASSVLLLVDTLSRHPEVQQKAYEEIQRVIGNDEPSYDHIAKMPYLRAMIKEGFRYNTSPLGNMRLMKHPVTLRGYNIPAGTTVVLSTMASKKMQNEKYGNPEKFAPERWLRSSETRVHPFSNLPFSFGKRLCAGKRLVEVEMSVLMMRLLQNYEIMENTFVKDQVNWVFKVIVTPDKPYTFYLNRRN